LVAGDAHAADLTGMGRVVVLVVLLAALIAPASARAERVDYAAYNRLADAVWAAHGDRCQGRAHPVVVDLIAGDDTMLGFATGVWDETCAYEVRRDLTAYEACVITVHERGHLAGYEPVDGVDAWHERRGLMSPVPVDAFPDPRQDSGRPPYVPCARLVRLPISDEMAQDAVLRRWPVRSLRCRAAAGGCTGVTASGRRVRWMVRYDARYRVVASRASRSSRNARSTALSVSASASS
jgi:hypothetical protein